MANSDIAFSFLRLLRSAGIFDHWEKIRHNLSVKAKVASMRKLLPVYFPDAEIHQQPNILRRGSESETLCTSIYGMAVAFCSFVFEVLIHGIVNLGLFWLSNQVIECVAWYT